MLMLSDRPAHPHVAEHMPCRFHGLAEYLSLAVPVPNTRKTSEPKHRKHVVEKPKAAHLDGFFLQVHHVRMFGRSELMCPMTPVE